MTGLTHSTPALLHDLIDLWLTRSWSLQSVSHQHLHTDTHTQYKVQLMNILAREIKEAETKTN